MKKHLSFLAVSAAALFTGLVCAGLGLSHPITSSETPSVKLLKEKFRAFYNKAAEDRVYVQTDKSFYQPGETVWFTAYLRDGETLKPSGNSEIIHLEFITPKGSTERHYKLVAKNGMAQGDFDLSAHPGGIYKIKAYTEWQKNEENGFRFEKEITVQQVMMPRLKMKIDFEKKAYGKGDAVAVKLELNTNENKALASTRVKFTASVEGKYIAEGSATTDAFGKATLKFILPKDLKSPDGLLNAMVDFEGTTESISRSIPIVLNQIRMEFFPEGGDLVNGMDSRVAFRAVNEFDKPADVEGVVLDSKGAVIQQFSSFHSGMGAFNIKPSPNEIYKARITKPEGIKEEFVLPEASKVGYVMRTTASDHSVQLSVNCWKSEALSIIAQTRGKIYFAQGFNATAGENSLTIHTDNFPIGVSQITLLDKNGIARCERLVFVNKERQLKISVTSEKQQYQPREKVTLNIKVTDQNGLPVPGNVSLSVVDDNILSFADDKQGNILSKVLLEPDLKEKVDEPNFYFDRKEPKVDQALDLLMMTSGWRRYTWKQIVRQDFPVVKFPGEKTEISGVVYDGYSGKPLPGALLKFTESGRTVTTDKEGKFSFSRIDLSRDNQLEISASEHQKVTQTMDEYGKDKSIYLFDNRYPRRWDAMPMAAEGRAAQEGGAKFKGQEELMENGEVQLMNMAAAPDIAEKPVDKVNEVVGDEKKFIEAKIADDRMDVLVAFDKKIAAPQNSIEYYRAKEFSRKIYSPTDTSRNDFATTVFWNGNIETDRNGRAQVNFTTNDLISSFKTTIEGFGDDGSIGRTEYNFSTNLPFTLDAKIPTEVVSGDKMMLPVFLKNNTPQDIHGTMVINTSKQLQVKTANSEVSIAAGQFKVVYLECSATNEIGDGRLEIRFLTPEFKDALIREVHVVAKGFPAAISLSGQELEKDFSINPTNVVPGSLKVTFTAYPNIMSELMTGVESILSEPHGCFEQTSASNYPNIMVLNYLKTMQVNDPALAARATKLLDDGYKKLVAFETKENGYEWFGAAPAHEALTAYGLMEFADMKKVYGGVDDKMLDRTVKLLLDKRDGNGGFKKNPQALDSFGAADEDVTNAYIVYALSEAGYKDILKELEAVVKSAKKSGDPYIMGLCANALFNVGDTERGDEMLSRIIKARNDAGYWTGAKHSITRSTGVSLNVETTSLILLALMKSRNPEMTAISGGTKYLVGARAGFGGFGSTQATILALKALTQYASFSKKTDEAGTVELLVNGSVIASKDYAKGERANISISGLEKHITDGKQKVAVRFKNCKHALPYAMNITYNTSLPESSKEGVIALESKLTSLQVKVGETLRLMATITNKTNSGQPMTIALIGIPAGLSAQPWQLKELQEKGVIDFYEVIGKSIACYYRALAPNARKQINFDLKAEIPGEYEAPASSAYLYYTAEKKDWKKTDKVFVNP